jgi:hypothetical protein
MVGNMAHPCYVFKGQQNTLTLLPAQDFLAIGISDSLIRVNKEMLGKFIEKIRNGEYIKLFSDSEHGLYTEPPPSERPGGIRIRVYEEGHCPGVNLTKNDRRRYLFMLQNIYDGMSDPPSILGFMDV